MQLILSVLGLGIFLTLVSGQYYDHEMLFWSFVISVGVTMFFYLMEMGLHKDEEGELHVGHFFFQTGTAIGSLLTFVLFIWLIVAVFD